MRFRKNYHYNDIEVTTYSRMCHMGKVIHMTDTVTKRGIMYYLTLSLIAAAITRCPNPEDIDHGSVRVVDYIRIYNELYASYSCEIGHALRGQSRRNCNFLTGEWEGQAPTCEKCELPITTIQPWDITINLFHTLHIASVDCGHPGNVTNGTVDVSKGTKLHATAWYTCDKGFTYNGTRRRTCGSDGRWSGATPTCGGQTLFNIQYLIWW